jgi:predicted small integral membrane protein
MLNFSWMAWTPPTAIFFAVIFSLIAAMAVWERASPGGGPRRGLLGIQTHRGDRLFITLLGSAFIHLAWIAFFPWPLWMATPVSAVYGLLVFSFI